ncbi:MAG: hypothetical protein LUG27_04395 [Clostridiales bacterium]|nr:hypothetical protein [Clostridiales bacterium]
MVGFIIFLLLLLFWEIVGIVASVYFVAVRVKKYLENPEASIFNRKKNTTVQDLRDAVAVKELLEKLGGSDSEAVQEIINAAAEQSQ